MARYIDVDTLIKLMEDSKYSDLETSFQRGVNSAIDYWITEIYHLPTVDDVLEVKVEKFFEEIESNMVNANFITGNVELNFGYYLALKNKYTEGGL